MALRKLREFYGIPINEPLPESMRSNAPDAGNMGQILKDDAWPPPLRGGRQKHSSFDFTPDGRIKSFFLDWNPYPDDLRFHPTNHVALEIISIVCDYYGIPMESSRVGFLPEEMTLGPNGQEAVVNFSNGDIHIKTYCNDVSRYAAIWVRSFE